MAEFGDVMTEFHKLPLPGKLAVGGAVVAVAAIAYARYRSQASSSSAPTTLGLSGADTGGSVSSNAPTDGGSGSTPTPTPTPTGNPIHITPPWGGGGPPFYPIDPVKLPPVKRPIWPIHWPVDPAKVPASTPAHVAQNALGDSMRTVITPPRPGTNHAMR